ncbi:MAG: dihydroorotate dehydrogenase-like protein [Bacteroidales bacterium]|nr:dihydroorotate dehydrogenase-like protein [Bacteroidales bacterium]
MADLKTIYMGIELKNPIIIGANNMVKNSTTVKKWEIEGAAAIVYKSLFEEQIQLESLELQETMDEYSERHAEMISLFPNIEHAGPKEYLLNLKAIKQTVSIPVFASLNAIYKETWVEYAQLIEETGVDGLELNFYAVPVEFDQSPEDVENKQIQILKAVKQKVKIPVSVKLSPFYSSPLQFISKLDEAKADAVIIFNRFFQPEIDIYNEKHFFPYDLSSESDNKLALRFSGLLYNKIKASICANGGIYTGEDVIKMLLAGANAVQIVSTLYKNRNGIIEKILEDIEAWMNKKNYSKIEDFRGKLSKKKITDPFVYKRAQYIDILMNSDNIFKKYPMV